MNIVINIRTTARLRRIAELNRRLEDMALGEVIAFDDVIESIDRNY